MGILFSIVAYACVAFSVIGFIELAVGFFTTKTYNLGRAIVYCLLFGVGLALL
jgi:hypothetical protein